MYDYFGDKIPPYTNPVDELIKLMHAKEKPDKSDLAKQQVLFDDYDTKLRGGILKTIQELKESSPPLDDHKLDKFRASSFSTQYGQLMIRAFRNLIRNTTFTRVRIGQIIILGALIDILFCNKNSYGEGDVRDKNGAFFFICTAQFMLAIQSVLLTCIYLILSSI